MTRHHRRCVPAVLLVFLLALSALAAPAGAHAAPESPVPRALALPHTLFPRGAKIRGEQAPNALAASVSTLHAQDVALLGRISGYTQSARWSVASGRGKSSLAVSLRYLGSYFESEDSASAALADARATLWEEGTPVHLTGITDSAFQVTGRSSDTVYLVRARGTVEQELWLTYPHRARAAVAHSLRHVLVRVAKGAAARAPAMSPEQVLPNAVAALPALSVAPAGTGPVIKSPSLMALSASMLPAGTTLLPGDYRDQVSHSGRLSSGQPAIVPGGALSRYAAVATYPGGAEVYNGTALYGAASPASAAMDRLVAVNNSVRGFRPLSLAAYAGGQPYLDHARVAAWAGGNEVVLAALEENVIVTFAATRVQPGDLVLLANRVLAMIPTWLHADGIRIADDAGQTVHLDGMNWYGAEENDFVVGGLDYRPYRDILSSIAHLGYNSIRLPFSEQMIEQNPVVTAHLAANPDLQGLHALDIVDRIVQYAGAVGLSVILDDHRADAGWSSEPLWYTPAYPETSFIRDWSTLAARYASTNAVIGADLWNEPHGAATWGDGSATDWRAAAQRGGDAVLAANPHLLIIVEGVQFYGSLPSYWWGGNLAGVAAAPVVLQYPGGLSAHDRLVYSAHDYGPDNCGGGCPWFNGSATYDSLAATWEQYWGFITSNPAAPYAAPLWVGEFGTCNYAQACVTSAAAGTQGQWFSSIVRYLGTKHLGWAYWSVNGTQSTGGTRVYGAVDWYGDFARDWSGPGPWVDAALRGIQTDVVTETGVSGP